MNDSDRTDEELEVYERIPWSDLLAEHGDARRWMPYVAVALVVAAATTGFILLNRRGETTVVTLPLQPVANVAPLQPEPVPVPVVPPSATPQLYSEADLMATLPAEDERQLSARAEWFVTDFFTMDGDAGRASSLEAHLPAGALPVFLEGGEAGVRTYVEWAKTLRVDQVSPSRFELLVAFRTLSAGPDQPFVRDPVRAVVVPILVNGAGEASVADLPTPARVPASSAVADWAPTTEAPPGYLIDQAQSALSIWGSDPQVVEVTATETGWRIVGTVTDASGVIWPLVVRISGSG